MKLVDVDQAVKQLREECDGCQLNEEQMDRECPTCWVTEALDALEKLPAVDAVPVVRCKDCEHLSMTTLGMEYACWHGATKVYGETGKKCGDTICNRITNPEHYCSYGERKDDAAD